MQSTGAARARIQPAPEAQPEQLPQLGRVAFLTNFIPPYRTSTLEQLGLRCRNLRVLISTAMEGNRQGWTNGWNGLDVVVQKTVTLKRSLKHPHRHDEANYVHIPVDTIGSLRAFDAEVIISAEMGFRTLFALLHRKLSPACTLLIWADIAESTELRRGLGRTLLRRVLTRAADAFIVNGKSGARYLQSIGVTPERMFAIPYATDIDRFYRPLTERQESNARRFLFVGQLIERKGLIPFLSVLSKWTSEHPSRAVTLVVAGDGPARERIASIALPPNLKLELLGNVAYDHLPSVYARADVLAFPTFADTWGLVANEAMAAGLPVLGSAGAQAVEEMVSEGNTGWVFNPENPSDMYSALDRCMNTDEDTLLKMRQRAQDTALQLSPDQVAESIQRAVLACMSQRQTAKAADSRNPSS